MNPEKILTHLKALRLNVVQILLFTLLLAVCGIGFVSSTAQSTKKEREVENKIPSHLPIKIKVKNFEKVKDLENDDWLRDLEIEVTNTGSKPIYYLRLGLSFMDVKKDSGANIGYTFDYGKGRLISIKNRATPEDIPMEPGASHVFKLHEDYIKGWRYYRTQVEKKPHPKKVELFFIHLSHGDGTGYVTTGGIFVSTITSSRGEKKGGGTIGGATDAAPSRPPDSFFQLSSFFLPANFLPVNFSPAKTSNPVASTTRPQTCCPDTSCERLPRESGGSEEGEGRTLGVGRVPRIRAVDRNLSSKRSRPQVVHRRAGGFSF